MGKFTVLDDFKAISVDYSATDSETHTSTRSAIREDYLVTTTETDSRTFHAHAKTDNAYLAARVSKATGNDPASDIRITELLTNTQTGTFCAYDSTRAEIFGDVVHVEGK